MQVVSWFRVAYADRPFWLFVACLAVLMIAGSFRGAPRLKHARGPWSPAVWLAIAAMAAYAAIAIWYWRLPTFYDHAEPTVGAIAWLFTVGQPIYHAPDAAERYSHMYGPLAFMIPGWSLEAFGPGLQQAKAAGIAAGLLSVALVYRLTRSATSAINAVVLTGLFAIDALIFRNISFWIRPDSLLMVFAALGLLGSSLVNPVLGAVIVGATTGVLLNLKLTGVLYALPVIGLFVARHGFRRIILVVVVSAFVAAWPFVAFDNVSFTNFRYWTQVSAANGLGFLTLRANIEWAIFLLLPLIPFALADLDARLSRLRLWGFGGLLAGVAGVTIAASKPGAGSSHLMPFLPAVFYLVAVCLDALPERVRRQPAWRYGPVAIAATAFAIAVCQQTLLIAGSTATASMDLAGDLARFANAQPASRPRIAMGAADTGERLTYLRPLLVFRSDFYPIDVPAMQEYQMSGLDLPTATLRALTTCQAQFWLFPKDGVPFAARNIYPSMQGRPIFSDAFRQTFAQHYERIDDTQYYQVWRCIERARVTDR